MSFNLVGELKIVSLLRGFSVSVQCSSSRSNHFWRNSLKSGVHSRKITAEQSSAHDSSKNVQFLCYEGFSIFRTDLKGNKNVI